MYLKKAVSLLLFFTLGASAESTTKWSFDYGNETSKVSGLVDFDRNDYLSASYLSNNISVRLTGWSDSKGLPNNKQTLNSDKYDGQITQSHLYQWSQGWGVVNNDEFECAKYHNGSEIRGYDGNCKKLTAAKGVEHSIDNYSRAGEKYSDLDMILLTFDEVVNLEGLQIGWSKNLYDNNKNLINAGGAIAINSKQLSNFKGSRWADVLDLGDSIPQMISERHDYYSNYYSLETGSLGSKYWLVGMFKEMFNSTHAGGFKLLGVTGTKVTQVTDVNEPQSIVIIAIGLLLIYRRKHKSL